MIQPQTKIGQISRHTTSNRNYSRSRRHRSFWKIAIARWQTVQVIISLLRSQSCPWVGLTHGLGEDFPVLGGLGWVECTIAKVLKVCKDYAFKARLDKIWLHQAVKFDFYGRSDRYRKLIRRSSNNVSQWQLDNDVDLEVLVNCIGLGPKFSTCSGLSWVGSVSWWVGLDRVIQNGPMDNSVLPNQSQRSTFTVIGYAEAGHHKSPMTCCLLEHRIPKFLYAKPVPIKQ